MLDRKQYLRHDILARAGVRWLRVDDVCIVTLLFNFTRGRGGRRRRWDLGAAAGGWLVIDHTSLLRHPVRRLHHTGVEVLQLVLKVRHGCDNGSRISEAVEMNERKLG